MFTEVDEEEESQSSLSRGPSSFIPGQPNTPSSLSTLSGTNGTDGASSAELREAYQKDDACGMDSHTNTVKRKSPTFHIVCHI